MNYSRKTRPTVKECVDGILNGDRVLLSRAITLIESQLSEDNQLARQIIEKIMPHTGNSIRIGITGVPGVGKSTFIESFGSFLVEHGHKLAVLAIDPSSKKSGGSILGDKTRMDTLSKSNNAFIRPSSAGASLGGVANKTRETLLLCEAAGYDVIIIETVGVGQSEIAVHDMVDFFLLLMLAGAGDELQGIKKGIMEMADGIAITKADGDNIPVAKKAKATYQNALHLFPLAESGWTAKVVTCSALENKGVNDIWQIINDYQQVVKKNGYWQEKRSQQNLSWMYASIDHYLKTRFFDHQTIKRELQEIIGQVKNGDILPLKAANELIRIFEGNAGKA
ncbi:methylmalonyl Co-A mutase-associated GTPase MeaB [Fulvivirgaceae bacterium BMA12]|uniref:Methylmalonyl Co-A mutase-associated GTPase MeaB n=1 Tax=Agaribacillus aureus TaxID=3051825 RepID=A0ABT8L451_9BACT|nr:methylmalonyl Co-A mutase-associated GTPase MeaB [Fulvivirgaceae bacterium BMA12]